MSVSPATSNPVPSETTPRSERWGEIVLIVIGLASISCWLALYQWYGLFENRNNTHFAFEKVPGQFDSPIIRRTLLLFLAVSLLYAVGYGLINRATRVSPVLKVGVLIAILGPGIINILLYPVGALDVFNYLIEIKLAYHYDINPYLETFEQYRSDSYALPAFLVKSYLFYGPVWLLVSWLPGAVVGYADVIHSLIAMKVLNAGLLILTALAIARDVADDARRRWLAAYALLANPLVLFEGLANAHNDVMMTCFLIAALVALRARSTMSGALLAASAMVKVFTAVLAPVFILFAWKQQWSARRIGVAVLLTAITVVLSFAPFWADGKMVDGLREGTTSSQEMNHVSIYSLAQQVERDREVDRMIVRAPMMERNRAAFAAQQLSPSEKARMQRIFGALFAVAVVILLIGVKRGRPIEAATIDILMLFSLLLTNLYAWYLIPIFAVLALRRTRLGTGYLFIATVLGLAYYPAYVWGHFSSGWQEKLHVHLFLALFLTVPMVLYLIAELGQWGYATVHARQHAGQRTNTAQNQAVSRGTRVTSS
jgi:hypothetical protein